MMANVAGSTTRRKRKFVIRHSCVDILSHSALEEFNIQRTRLSMIPMACVIRRKPRATC